ncbi:MAG: primase-helicase zinc-binding domain-containing protein [Pirellulales bacterium]
MNLQDVKAAAIGRWPEILVNVAGIPDDFLSGREVPCPRCGGNTRFRFTNLQNNGSVFCSHCARGLGDGIDAVGWMLGIGSRDSIQRIGDFLGLKNGRSHLFRPSTPSARPAEPVNRIEQAIKDLEKIHSQLTAIKWDQAAVAMWCYRRNSNGLTDPDAIKSCGAFCAKYQPGKRVFTVLAVPCKDNESVVGYFLFNLRDRFLPGKKLPDGSYEQLKVKAVGIGLGVAE